MALPELLDDIRKRPGSGDVIAVIDPRPKRSSPNYDCGAEAVDEAVAAAKSSSAGVGRSCRAVSGPRSCGGSRI